MQGLSASTGSGAGSEEGARRDAEPFISGNFEYGVGRMAARRKVYLFCNRAQEQRLLADASVQFLGVYKTDKRVCRCLFSSLRLNAHILFSQCLGPAVILVTFSARCQGCQCTALLS